LVEGGNRPEESIDGGSGARAMKGDREMGGLAIGSNRCGDQVRGGKGLIKWGKNGDIKETLRNSLVMKKGRLKRRRV